MSRTNTTIWTQVTAVGLLSAILASGGTYAVVQASQDEQPIVLDAATRGAYHGSAEPPHHAGFGKGL